MSKANSLSKITNEPLGSAKDMTFNGYSDGVLEAFHSIINAGIIIELYTNKQHKKYNIRQPSVSIINALFENGGTLPQKRLVKHLGRTRQATALALSKLEKIQIISREESQFDRRRRTVKLTEKGWKLAKEIRPFHDQFFQIFTAYINKSDRKKLELILNKLSNKFTRDMKKFSQLKRRRAG